MANEKISLLFTMFGQNGRIRKSRKNDNLEISFDINEDGLIWFQDRPGRNSGPGNVSDFSNNFRRMFEGDMPNSALTYKDKKTGDLQTLIMKNKSFKYNEKKGRVKAIAILNDDIEAEACGLQHSLNKDGLTNYKGGKFKTGSMFIDNSPTAGQKAAIGTCSACAGVLGLTFAVSLAVAEDGGGSDTEVTTAAMKSDAPLCHLCSKYYEEYGF